MDFNINTGFEIDEKTFSKMQPSKQRLILFQTIKKRNRLIDRIQFIWLFLLTSFMGFIRFIK